MTNPTIAVVLAGSTLAGCVAPEPEPTSTTGQALIDQANTTLYSTPGFWFQPPLVDTSVTSGPFDGTFASRLTVDLTEVDCTNSGAVGATVHTFDTVQVVPSTERYKVTFTDIAAVGLVDQQCYRIIPRLDGGALGYRDMLVSSSPGPAPIGYKKWGVGPSAKVIAFRLEDMDPDGDGVVSPLDECDYDPDAGDGIYIPGQVATWLGDGTAEAMYSGGDGVWTGTEAYIAGVVGDAFAFDGASYVSGEMPANSSFTVQLWVRADAIQPRNYGLLSVAGPQGFQIDWNASGGYRFATANGFNRNFGPASTTEFQHLVAVSPGGSSIVLYVDGVQVASGTNSNGHTIDDVAIGTNRNRLLHFHGAIDDVRMWNRPLTAAEVAAIYVNGPGGVCRGEFF